jgi:hypothetical protein
MRQADEQVHKIVRFGAAEPRLFLGCPILRAGFGAKGGSDEPSWPGA